MVDMNQSIENIMEQCDRIAFNEFKSDIDRYSKERRFSELRSGHHYNKNDFDLPYSYTDKKTKSVRDYGTGNGGEYRNSDDNKVLTAKDKKWIDNKNKARSRLIDDAENTRDYVRGYNKKHPEEAKHAAMALRKNESASIFDTLLDQV